MNQFLKENLISENNDDKISCNQCKNILVEPVECFICGYKMCGKDLIKLKNKFCPSCKDGSFEAVKNFSEIVQNYKAYCDECGQMHNQFELLFCTSNLNNKNNESNKYYDNEQIQSTIRILTILVDVMQMVWMFNHNDVFLVSLIPAQLLFFNTYQFIQQSNKYKEIYSPFQTQLDISNHSFPDRKLDNDFRLEVWKNRVDYGFKSIVILQFNLFYLVSMGWNQIGMRNGVAYLLLSNFFNFFSLGIALVFFYRVNDVYKPTGHLLFQSLQKDGKGDNWQMVVMSGITIGVGAMTILIAWGITGGVLVVIQFAIGLGLQQRFKEFMATFHDDRIWFKNFILSYNYWVWFLIRQKGQYIDKFGILAVLAAQILPLNFLVFMVVCGYIGIIMIVLMFNVAVQLLFQGMNLNFKGEIFDVSIQ